MTNKIATKKDKETATLPNTSTGVFQAPVKYGESELQLIKDMYARNATNAELKLLVYMSKTYNLDILTKEIWCVKYKEQPAQIYSGRDGFLKIAHSHPTFDGMESKAIRNWRGKLKGAWCKVWRSDMEKPFYVEVSFNEYDTGMALWKSKPATMIKKVAESQCLRKAFSISGLYSPEEMGQWEEEQKKNYRYVDKIQPQLSNTSYRSHDKKFQSNEEYWKKYDFSKVNLRDIPPSRGFDKEKKKPKPSIESLKIYFYAKEIVTDEEIKGFFEGITGKQKSWEYSYQDIKNILAALEEVKKQESIDEEAIQQEFEEEEINNE